MPVTVAEAYALGFISVFILAAMAYIGYVIIDDLIQSIRWQQKKEMIEMIDERMDNHRKHYHKRDDQQ